MRYKNTDKFSEVLCTSAPLTVFPNSHSQADVTGMCHSIAGRKENLVVHGKRWQVWAPVSHETGWWVGYGKQKARVDRGWGVTLEWWVLKCKGTTCMERWRPLIAQYVPKRKKSLSMISRLTAAPWGPQYNSLLLMWKQELARKHG